MRTYLETKIHACGRDFGVIVSDDRDMPFTAGRLALENDRVDGDVLRCDNRSDAIEHAAACAVNFLRGAA